ncbi:hypothetical protein [Enterococcus sp.]|uniref:hypothetical protein n=1 Tax=Enterococcus sp. TaxID=35783 RepID=UPI00289E754A|nr:hypothetical protein [Enterococcus sp.]
MKREITEKFEKLDLFVETEIKSIVEQLLEEHKTYEELLQSLVDDYSSKYKLDDLIYSEIYKRMIKQATK